MKTTYPTIRRISLVAFAAAMLVTLYSCKKDSQSYDPVPPTPKPDTVNREVFVNSEKILTVEEISGAKPFMAGHACGNMYRRNLLGGPLDWFDRGFAIFSTIEAFKATAEENQQFAHIDSTLSNIQNQLTQIQNQLDGLAALINKTTSEILEAVYDFGAPGNAGDIIQTYYSPLIPTSTNYLTYYSFQAQQHNSGSHTDSLYITQTLAPKMYSFANFIYSGAGSEAFGPALNTLADLGVGQGEYQQPACISMANYLIGQNSSTSPIHLYMVMENYFLQLLTYQFQGALINMNVNRLLDSTNVSTIQADFDTVVCQEARAFLKAAQYMAMFVDYRSLSNWLTDCNYLNYGLSPNNVSNNILSRATFITNMLYAALGLPYPVLNGYIILPHYYSQGTGATPTANFTVSYLGESHTSSPLSTIASSIPYTYWQYGSGSNANIFRYDNQWNLYSYRNGTGGSLAATPIPINLTNSAWGGSSTSVGSVTPKWYNPRNPKETSTTQTDSCVVQFAFFSSAWWWGYPAIVHTQGAIRYNPDPWDNVGTSSDNCHCPGDQAGTPFVNQYHSTQCKWESGGSVSTSGCFNTYAANGTYYSYSGGQVYFVDGFYWPMANGNNLGGVTLFNSWGYWSSGAGWHHQFLKFGTQISEGYCTSVSYLDGTISMGKDIYWSGDVPDWPMGWHSGNNSIPLTGSSWNLGFEVQLGVWELNYNSSFQVMMYLQSQPIFEGSCNYSPLTP